MRLDLPDRYSRGGGPVQGLASTLKLTIALILILAVLLAPFSWVPVGVAVFLVGVAGVSRVPPSFLFRRLLLMEPFALGVAGLAFWQPEGMHVFLVLMMRSTLCLFTMVLLSATTPFSDLLGAMRRLGMPSLLVGTLGLAFRYVFVLAEETERMRRARACRTFTGGRRLAWRSAASVIGRLFLRSSERAERIYAAMCARGWR